MGTAYRNSIVRQSCGASPSLPVRRAPRHFYPMTTSQTPRPPASYRPTEAPTSALAPTSGALATVRLLALPSAFALLLAAFALFTQDPVLIGTFVGAAAGLLLWTAALYVRAQRTGRALSIEIVARKQHWVQACGQGTLILYWAANNHFVFGFFPFILAELVFAYSFDSLLNWSRRDRYTLGFGPFPIIFSISLFMLFRPHWF